MRVAVIGGGKIGLPLAAQFASCGAQVTVNDINPAVVDAINAGRAPFVEPELDAKLAAAVASESLRASPDTSQTVKECEAIVVVVPALLTPEHDIDWGNLVAASRAIAAGLRPGALVSYETTVPVGGTRSRLKPVLEESGLVAGRDFHLCFSPERVKSKHIFEHLTRTPKVVGGVNPQSARRGAEFYGRYLGAETLSIGSLEAAEFVKLAGMIYRDVNIALVNELAAYAEALDLDGPAIFAAANTDNETAMLRPGIGVGGHCTPVYPYFLIRQAERLALPHGFASLARRVNEGQPAHELQRLSRTLNGLSGRRVHILGLGFRPDIKEHAFSPAFALRDALSRQGAHVTIEDPLYDSQELTRHGFAVAAAGHDRLDAVVLNTAHKAFLDPDLAAWKASGIEAALDGRNIWNPRRFADAGIAYLAVGVGSQV